MIKIIKKLRHVTEIIILDKSYLIENEVIYKHNLHKITEITKEELYEILNDNKVFYFDRLAKGRMKKHSTEVDIRSFLKEKGATKIIIDNLVDEYKKLNYINDKNFVESYLNHNDNKDGPNNLFHKLKQKGVNIDLIKDGLKDIDEEEAIYSSINKQLLRYKDKNKYQMSNGIKTYYVNKGFNELVVIKIVDKVLKDIKTNEVDLAIKDYNKLFNKFSNKKDESELTDFIKNKLFSLGYSEDTIHSVFNSLKV